MLTWIFTGLSWAKVNWKLLSVIAVLASVYFVGAHRGAVSEHRRYEAKMQLGRDRAQKEKDAAQLRANQHSASYEAEIAKQKQTIISLGRTLQYEIKRSYATCTANDDIVRLWHQTFPAAAGNNTAR